MPDPLAPLVGALAPAIAAALRPMVAEMVAEPLPTYLDRGRLGRELCCAPATIDRMVKEGLPFVRVGSDRRFDLHAVKAWLESKTNGEETDMRGATQAAE